MPRPGPVRRKLQFRDDDWLINWVRETADVEFPTARGPGNEAALLRKLVREAIATRERRAIRRAHDRAPVEPKP